MDESQNWPIKIEPIVKHEMPQKWLLFDEIYVFGEEEECLFGGAKKGFPHVSSHTATSYPTQCMHGKEANPEGKDTRCISSSNTEMLIGNLHV